MDITLTSETADLWAFWKRLDRDRYFASVGGMPPQQGPRYRTQFGQVIYAPAGLEERQSHKAAKHMAVSLLTPPQRAAYEAGTLNVYVVDDLGRRHWLMYGAKGSLGVKSSGGASAPSH